MARESAIELRGALWMVAGTKSLGGAGRIELLARIAELGSISQAAKAMKMSYKAAWDAVDQMNNVAGVPLVERAAGGKGGGSTRLTPRGQQLVANFRLIEQEHRRFIDLLSSQAGGLTEELRLIGRLGMRTSARNQFLGKVTDIRRGAVNDEIDLEIVGGQTIVAIITHDSTGNLGLRVGCEAIALVKASSIILVTDAEGSHLSARNRMTGIISRVQAGAVNSEVVIDLPGGGTIVSIITNESVANLGFRPGRRASAFFEASSVIIGLPI